MSNFDEEYTTRKLGWAEGREFIKANHYSGGCHNGPYMVGLERDGELVGACAFATPCSENVRKSVFGADKKDWVTELHRLVVLRPHPDNLTSWFVARAMRALVADKPVIKAIISYADQTEGHVGTIYQALGFIYAGSTGRARFYRDSAGVLRHPRQCGVNISLEAAKERGWTSEMRDSKHRYVRLLPSSRRERAQLPKMLLLEPLPYPTKET